MGWLLWPGVSHKHRFLTMACPFSTTNAIELGGDPGGPHSGRVGADSLREGSWKTAAWAGVRSGAEQRKRECQALEGAASVGWALLPGLGVGSSRPQALQESAGV